VTNTPTILPQILELPTALGAPAPYILHVSLDWDTFKKLCVSSLFLVEAYSYTVRTNGSTHGRKIVFCEKMVVHNVENQWAVVVQKNHLLALTWLRPPA